MRNSGRITKGAGPDWKATDRRIYNLLTHSPHLLDLAGHLVGPIEKVRAIHRERDITADAAEDTILKGAPLVNANLEDGIEAVKVMVAVGHSARHGGDWVNVEEVEGDLAHSHLRRLQLVAA